MKDRKKLRGYEYNADSFVYCPRIAACLWWLVSMISCAANSSALNAKEVVSDLGKARVFTVRDSSFVSDKRFGYEQELIRLALEKSRDRYGEYELKFTAGMNLARAIETSRLNKHENLFFKTSYTKKHTKHLTYIPIPVDKGIVGYRICFTSKAVQEKLRNMNTLDDIRKLTIGQGQQWLDVEIFRHNKFKVREIAGYNSLFYMVAENRFDLFCRGANEVKAEWEEFRSIENLVLDDSIALFYPLPRFFWTNKKNIDAVERVSYGLQKAYDDGTLRALWENFYLESVKFSNIKQRKIFVLENPQLIDLDTDYQKFFYNPLN